jgi:hypothetical protein
MKKKKKEEEVWRDITSPSSKDRKREAPGGSSSSSESKLYISRKESYLPRPWLETVPGPPAPFASWWISSGSLSSPSTQSSTSSGAFRGADGEGRRLLKGITQGENNGTLCEAAQSATVATLSCALGVVGGMEDYAGVDTGETSI